MTSLTVSAKGWAAAAVDSWRTFWFRPQPAYTLGAVRIAFGAVIVAWTLSLLPGFSDFFSVNGFVPGQPEVPHEWGVFEYWTDNRSLMIGWALLLISALAMTIGWHSRLAAIVVCVLVMSFQFRNSYIFNSGDNLIRVEAFFLALSPCGAALSADQYRATGAFWSAQYRAPYALRLMQIQLTLIYLATFQIRLRGDKWPEGTALSYALRLEDMLIIPLPHWVTTNAALMNVAAWGLLVVEALIGILVWNKRLRLPALAVGVTLHLFVMLTIAVGFFTPAMFVLYLAFASPETIRDLPTRLKAFAGSRRPRRRRQATITPATIPAEPERTGEPVPS